MVHGRPKSVVQLDGDLLHELQIDPRNRDLFQSTRDGYIIFLEYLLFVSFISKHLSFVLVREIKTGTFTYEEIKSYIF